MKPKFNIKTSSGLNNHLATLDNLMEQVVRCRLTVSNEHRINMYAQFLHMWFKFEKAQLTPDSPTLLELLQQQQSDIIDVLTEWKQ